MIFDPKKFARKYALIYTAVLAVLLIVPLITYIALLLQIDEAKVKLALESQAKKIIVSMQKYKNSDKVYNFPRYKEYKAALLDDKYQKIFSTSDFELTSFTEGFHHEGSRYYYIYPLPPGYYFGASYLLVETNHTASYIYLFALSVMVAIVGALFIFSLLLLKNFSAPFEKLNTQLDNFIKDSMHEINTPLSIINLNADLFANKYGENKYLWRIKSASKTLATIYNDMDYLIKQGRVEYKKELMDFGEFIQNRVDYFQEIANMKNIILKTDIENGVIYKCSKTKLQRIVDNTISNAIKYSHDNTQVDIILKIKNENIIFEVKDQGVGIKNVKKIFSRYYRENEAKGGFGIGLNIVKQIIDEEDILLDVSSTPGHGTTFTYTFLPK
ncbi:sensor histidine kinase [Sulfurovum sp. ST-21]|uniref:histidine kinase n=1 Tax=Sulfurovum indicum TaxID=2779528 RepID=A0A7M1S2R8_9BACT|nr:HAMP domain-containing sensor histidine kinase [Sulfurovum indicum]QOR61494.1 HAMP domain-containing histidine kinase [Sulfurovum indicum]